MNISMKILLLFPTLFLLISANTTGLIFLPNSVNASDMNILSGYNLTVPENVTYSDPFFFKDVILPTCELFEKLYIKPASGESSSQKTSSCIDWFETQQGYEMIVKYILTH